MRLTRTFFIKITKARSYWKKMDVKVPENETVPLIFVISFSPDQIEKGNVQVLYCPTDQMIVDYMTKPLHGLKFQDFWDRIIRTQAGVTPGHAGRKINFGERDKQKTFSKKDRAERGFDLNVWNEQGFVARDCRKTRQRPRQISFFLTFSIDSQFPSHCIFVHHQHQQHVCLPPSSRSTTSSQPEDISVATKPKPLKNSMPIKSLDYISSFADRLLEGHDKPRPLALLQPSRKTQRRRTLLSR